MVVLGADNSFYSFWKGFKVFHPWFLEFFPVEEIVFYWESYFCRKKNDMHAFNYIVISIFLIGETLTGRIFVIGVLKNFRGTCPCRSAIQLLAAGTYQGTHSAGFDYTKTYTETFKKLILCSNQLETNIYTE